MRHADVWLKWNTLGALSQVQARITEALRFVPALVTVGLMVEVMSAVTGCVGLFFQALEEAVLLRVGYCSC